MTDQFSVQSGALQGLSGIHGEVGAGVQQIAGTSPEAGATELGSGTIAAPFTSALGQALPSREGALRATSTSSQQIAEILKAAAQRYDAGDAEGAEKLRAAADALAESEGQPGGAATAGSGTSTASGAGTGGAESAGQLAGQVGQQVGQLAQGVAQSVQGLAQGLTQLPQQIMQGVAGIVQATSQGAGSAQAKLDAAKSDDPEARKREEAEAAKEREAREREAKERKAGERARDGGPDATTQDGAGAGRTAEQGPAPQPVPPVDRPRPAQTRPQQSAL